MRAYQVPQLFRQQRQHHSLLLLVVFGPPHLLFKIQSLLTVPVLAQLSFLLHSLGPTHHLVS